MRNECLERSNVSRLRQVWVYLHSRFALVGLVLLEKLLNLATRKARNPFEERWANSQVGNVIAMR